MALAKLSEGRPPGPDFAAAPTPMLVKLVERRESTSSFTDAVEALAAFKELTEPPEKEDGFLSSLAKVAGPAVAALITQQAPAAALPAPAGTQPAQGDQASLRTGAAAGVRSGPTVSPDGGQSRPPDGPPLAAYVPLPVNAARNDTDPQSYCDLIFDLLSDEQLDSLIAALKKEDSCQGLFASHPDVSAHMTWFEQLRQLLIEPPDEPPAQASSEWQRVTRRHPLAASDKSKGVRLPFVRLTPLSHCDKTLVTRPAGPFGAGGKTPFVPPCPPAPPWPRWNEFVPIVTAEPDV